MSRPVTGDPMRTIKIILNTVTGAVQVTMSVMRSLLSPVITKVATAGVTAAFANTVFYTGHVSVIVNGLTCTFASSLIC